MPSTQCSGTMVHRGAWIYCCADAPGDPVIGNVLGGTQAIDVGRRLFTILQIVVLTAMLVFIGSLAVNHGSSESSLGRDLQRRGVHTVGIVTATELSNHDYFSYSFTIEGWHYSGDTTAFTSGQTVLASQLHVGQNIPVIYDAKDPRRSCSCDVNLMASTAWSNDLAPLILLVVGAAVMVVTLLLRLRRRQ
jgi:hypothetical protein